MVSAMNLTDYQKRCVNGGRGERGISLREAVEAFINDAQGDSSSQVKISDGWLYAKVYNSTRTKSRMFPLTMFKSVSDFLMTQKELEAIEYA